METFVDAPLNVVEGDVARIEISASEAAHEAISRLARTEDLKFSPDNHKLAIAGFVEHSCFVFDIEWDRSGSRPAIRFSDYVEVRSPALKSPHGFDWVDDETLVVANRGGNVSVFAVPERVGEERIHYLIPLLGLDRVGLRRMDSPGSVSVIGVEGARVEVLVCNNYSHQVSRHVFRLGSGLQIPRSSVLLKHGLQIPDGIALTPDRSWVAISNHATHSVLIFDARVGLGPASVAVGTLSGVDYPHGIRFSVDGRRLYVADAGAPFIHVFEASGTDWGGERTPTSSVRVMSDDTYLRGRKNPEEGGTKGLDLDATGEVMGVTCEEQPLAFFHLPSLFP